MQVWRDFLAAHAGVIEALGREMESEQALPLNWFDVLVHLSEAPGMRLRMQDLAASVLLSRSGLTRRIDRMVESGLVRREPSPEDRRSTYAVLTEEGLGKLLQLVPGHRRNVERYFRRHLSQRDARVLQTVFAKILDTAHDAGPEPTAAPSSD